MNKPKFISTLFLPLLLPLLACGDNSSVTLEYCDDFYEWDKLQWSEVRVPSSASIEQVAWRDDDIDAAPWLQEIRTVSVEIEPHPKLRPIEMTSTNPQCPTRTILPLAVTVVAGDILIVDDGRDDKRWKAGDLPPWQKAQFSRVIMEADNSRVELYAEPESALTMDAPSIVTDALPSWDGYSDPVLVLTAELQQDGTSDVGFLALSKAERGNSRYRSSVGYAPTATNSGWQD